jgi:hypothetical protein
VQREGADQAEQILAVGPATASPLEDSRFERALERCGG